MSIKGKIAEIILLGVIKWVIVLIFAGVIIYFITPKFEIIDNNKLFNKTTGKIEKIEFKIINLYCQ